MKILMLGGTRFFGRYTVSELLDRGHEVTIATRGLSKDSFADKVHRVKYDRTDGESVKNILSGNYYDIIIDKIAYASNDIKSVLDYACCGKYVQMSSTAVYTPFHLNLVEDDFNPLENELIWGDRNDFDYSEAKRQAEYAMAQCYGDKKMLSVRYPVVLGKDDYTKRLEFYVEHILNEKPMYIDNMDSQMSFIDSREAGEFMAYISTTDVTGAINGASSGTVSIREIINYVEKKCGRKAILNHDGDVAPYNGTPEFSVNTEKANELGFTFSNINDWLYNLLDYYIEGEKC